MNTRASGILLVVRYFAALFAFSVFAQAPTPPDPGLKLGQTLPPFTLTDQNGKAQTLQSLAGEKGLMLVFYRSADW